MATTTNYGWTTPDDTALVKDGAAAIRTLGSSIDTTVFNNASAGIPKTIVDAKGDLIAATAADTVACLAVGANDTVLTADSTTATGLKWATAATGGMTLLSTTTLSGASVTLSGISADYTHLYLLVSGITSVGAGTFRIAPNGITNISNNFTRASDTTVAMSVGDYLNPLASANGSATNQISATGGLNAISVWINNYSSTTAYKPFSGYGVYVNGSAAQAAGFSLGGIRTTSAISSLVLSHFGGNFNAGTVLLYGVK